MSNMVELVGFGSGGGSVGGGGGASLNFKFTAYETESDLLNATPSDNTIGVITTEPITGYIFASTVPNVTYADNGLIWVTTGTASAVEFNAIKKNAIQIYPITAMQYVYGEWISVTAKSRIDGVWEDWWNGELFVSGNEFETFTGGWAFSGEETGTDQGNDGTRIRLGSTTASKNENKYTYTVNKIDLTSYDVIEISITGGYLGFTNGSSVKLQVVDSVGYTSSPVASVTILDKAKGDVSAAVGQLAVSGITGSYHIQIIIEWDSGTNVANKEYIDFSRVVCL